MNVETTVLKDSKSYHNAKLLLEQYHKVIWRLTLDLEDMESLINEDFNAELYDYIDILADIDTSVKKERLAQRLQSLEHSKYLVLLMDKAVVQMSEYPTNGQYYQQLVRKRYMEHNRLKVDDMLDSFNISRRTYYKDLKKAISVLGIILWGFNEKKQLA